MIVTEIMRMLRTLGHGQAILRIFVRTFQHASGLSQPLLEYPDQRAPHLKGYYYVYLRKFLSEHKMQLECACATCPELKRKNDMFLMDAACAKSKADLSDPNIRTINYCRSYLEVQRLSDICTADGHYILESVLDGQQSVTQSQSQLEEIIQERPENKEWCVCGAIFFINTVMKDQPDSSKVLVSGLHQSSHQNTYDHTIFRVRITPYIKNTEKTGMTIQSTSLMNMNVMMKMYFILYPKRER